LAKENLTGIFNPFESKINEHGEEEEEDFEATPIKSHISDNSFDRE